jgi:hypothetical protein
MDPLNPEFPKPYTFCNCGKKKCPTLRQTAEGIVLEAPLAEIVSTEGSAGVLFSPEQARELRLELEKRGF